MLTKALPANALLALAVCCCGFMSSAAAINGSSTAAAIGPEEQADGLSDSMVRFGGVAQALDMLSSTIVDLALMGELSLAGQEQLELLIGGITGQLTAEAQNYVPEDTGFQNIDDFGQGGPAPDNNVYLSQITPSRQIMLSGSPARASAPGEPGDRDLSVWIDDDGNAFVLGDPAAPDGIQQLSLKQGWEKDYDKLSSQIEQLLAEFMKQHAEDQSPAGDGTPPPGEAI